VPVLCEKPFTTTVSSALDVLRAAHDGGTLVAMASKFRWVDAIVQARALLASGAAGVPLGLEIAFASFTDMRGRWNAEREVAGGGVLIDNGSHALDLARWFVGPLVEIEASEGPRPQGLAVEETVRLTARSRAGALAGIDLSGSLDRGSDVYLTGSEGVVLVGWEGGRRRGRGEGWTHFGSPYRKLTALGLQLVDFARAVRGEAASLVTPLESVASVVAVEAAYAALRSGRRTAIHELVAVPGAKPRPAADVS
jgi:predicted dehydrogenase